MILSTVEMHTGGEPTRIVVDGWPRFEGRTLLDKRREAKERFDHLRRGLMLEPRGHDGMYGALLVEPDHPEADLAVLFMHNEGWSTMCGHATIALARWAVESGRVKGPTVRLQCPCGLVVAQRRGRRLGALRERAVLRLRARPHRADADLGPGDGRYRLWRRLLCRSCRPIRSASTCARSPMRAIADAGEEIAQAVAKAVPIEHPDEPDLAFLYGTILTDGGDGASAPSRNVCIFAGRQIDRSPTGSGVSRAWRCRSRGGRRGWASSAGSRAAPARSSPARRCARRRRSARARR